MDWYNATPSKPVASYRLLLRLGTWQFSSRPAHSVASVSYILITSMSGLGYGVQRTQIDLPLQTVENLINGTKIHVLFAQCFIPMLLFLWNRMRLGLPEHKSTQFFESRQSVVKKLYMRTSKRNQNGRYIKEMVGCYFAVNIIMIFGYSQKTMAINIFTLLYVHVCLLRIATKESFCMVCPHFQVDRWRTHQQCGGKRYT